MIKKIITIVLLLMAYTSHAQNVRTDTILLSVYNTGNRYRLIPAAFGSTTPRVGIIETAVDLPDSSAVTLPPVGVRLADSVMRSNESGNKNSVFQYHPKSG